MRACEHHGSRQRSKSSILGTARGSYIRLTTGTCMKFTECMAAYEPVSSSYHFDLEIATPKGIDLCRIKLVKKSLFLYTKCIFSLAILTLL